MQILRSVPRLLSRPNVATSPASMHRLSSPSQTLLSFMPSAPPRWWPSALARRFSPLGAAPDPPARRVSRFPQVSRNTATVSRVQGDKSGKPYMPLPMSSGKVITISQGSEHYAIIAQGMENIKTDNSKKMKNIEEGGRIATNDQMSESILSEEKGYTVKNVLAQSRHRDGSIYKDMDLWWKTDYRIADRNETRLEAMAFSDPTDCIFRDGTCMKHHSRRMLQIFSLEVAKIHMDGGLVELYGYIAVRDDLDPLLNYVANISRDDPIIVEQGSVINMAGPKRGIEMSDLTLIEYDMRIKTGKQEKDDIQLIDGASLIGHGGAWNQPFTFHIPGDSGAVDITLSRLCRAVEATVEVLISEVQSNFSLSLGCLTSGLDVEIRLFDGAITESRGLKRSVVAVVKDSLIDLKFKVGAPSSSSDQYSCSFKAKTHGHDTQGIKTDFALISMKVTWSTLPCGFSG